MSDTVAVVLRTEPTQGASLLAELTDGVRKAERRVLTMTEQAKDVADRVFGVPPSMPDDLQNASAADQAHRAVGDLHAALAQLHGQLARLASL